MSGSATALGRISSVPVGFRRRDLLIFAPLALLMGYLASPYVAMARLGYAIRTNDVSVLSDAVDWSRVRTGLDQEIMGTALPQPMARATAATTDDDLPDFGQSFAATATASAMATTITPTGLEAILANEKRSSAGLLAEAKQAIGGAVFIGLNRFEIRLPSDAGVRGAMVRVGFRFTARHGWRVERVVLPAAAIDGTTQRT